MLFIFIKGLFIGAIYGTISYILYFNTKRFLLLVSSLVLLTSCTEEEVSTPTCINNDCSAQLSIPGQLDVNGFYHIDLDWTGDHYPRFSIDIDLSLIHI